MDIALDITIAFLWIAVFSLGFGIVYKILNSKFRRSEDKTPWDDLKENVITLLSFGSGGLALTSMVYFFQDDNLNLAIFLSSTFFVIYSIGTIFTTACWLDAKLELEKGVTFKGAVLTIGVIILFSWSWKKK